MTYLNRYFRTEISKGEFCGDLPGSPPFPRLRPWCYTSPVEVPREFLAEVPHVFHIIVLQIMFRFGSSFGGCIGAASDSPGSRAGAAGDSRHSRGPHLQSLARNLQQR